MLEQDFSEFGRMLDGVCRLLTRGSYVPDAQNTALFFRALQRHDIASVRAGFDAHVSDPVRGKFAPVPADILAQIEARQADDGRPGAEEAWAIAARCADEANTVVWTDEMAQAWGTARAVFDSGDEVGARMAFKETYSRLVAEARRVRAAPKWTASLGHDTSQHAEVQQRAHVAGLLPKPDLVALPPPEKAFAALTAQAPPEVREKLLALRETLVARSSAPSWDQVARERTEALKVESAAKAVAHEEVSRGQL